MTYEEYNPRQALDVIRVLDAAGVAPAWLLDCGPGLGREAHRFKERWGAELTVIGLEPNRRTADAVRAGYPGRLLDAAAWDSDGTAEMYGLDTDMGASLVHQGVGSPPVTVDTLRLDAVLPAAGVAPDSVVVWADVEGSERRVLAGAAGLFAAGAVAAVNLEVYAGADEDDMTALMRGLGFRPALRYAGNGAHLDVLYLRGLTGPPPEDLAR